MNIVRWNPRREMLRMQQDMDRMMDSLFQTNAGTSGFDLALDVAETENAYEVSATVPGVKVEDIDITLDRNVLTIQGESHAEQTQEGQRYHIRERRYGSFARSVRLPEGIKGDEISADYDNGVLKIHIPKAEETKPKRIEVSGSSASRTIDVEQQQ